MPRGKMSPEARARISRAKKAYWARVRAEKRAGGGMGQPSVGRRRGRPPRANSNANPFLNMTVAQLIQAKQQLDQAWSMATRMMRRA
jgi:hypothetical protein